MVKSSRPVRPLAATDRSSVSGSASSMENTYCVVLHVVEAINFYGREMREGEREQIIMTAALNTVDFEVVGTPSTTAETILFNSNCIWECDMTGIKRIKTDHRPVKVTFYTCSKAERKTIGSLLLPVRGLPVLGIGGNNSPLQLKMFWHKLICISNEFRSHKPEVLLMLAIIKKTLLHTKDFKHLMAFNNGSEKPERTPPLQSPGHSITANMLQSQANVYVQSLVQLGLLQVGNDPLVDCDIIEVVLQFKQLKNLSKFVRSLYQGKDVVKTVLLMFDFVGNVTNIDLNLNEADTYELNDVLGLRFKSSLRSIRLYFQRIFYLPINMYINGTSIANYRMDFGKLLPQDNYFADKRKYVHSGSFAFERFGRMASARELKPVIDYTFTVDIQEVCWRQQDQYPGQEQHQLQEEQSIDLQSVGSKAVIHEVPKDRPQDSLVDWQPNSEKQSASENASVRSLNVGAELSDSDEQDTDSESSQARRRKFTRLIENNPILEEEEERSEHHVTSMLSPSHKLEDELLPYDDLVNIPEEISCDSELLDSIYGSVEKPKVLKKNKQRNSAPVTERNADEDPRDQDLNSQRSIQEVRSKLQVNARTVKFLQEEMQLKQQISKKSGRKTTNVDYASDEQGFLQEAVRLKDQMTKIGRKTKVNDVPQYKVDDSITEDSFCRLERECEMWPQPVINSKAVEESTDKAETRPVPDPSRMASEIDSDPRRASVSKLIEEHSKVNTIKKKLSADNVMSINSKIIRKNKISLKTHEFEQLKDKDDDEQELKLQSRDDLTKNQRKNPVVDNSLDMDSITESEELQAFLPKPKTLSNKSKLFIQTEAKPCEKVLVKKVSKTKKINLSNTDVSLSARWVRVNQEQAKALEETEMFIENTCRVGQDETSNEEQVSEGPKKSTRKKLERSPHLSQRNNIEFSSELESSVIEEPKLERKVVTRKKSADLRERGPQMNQSRPRSSRVNELIQSQMKHVESVLSSEMESTELEEANSIRTPEKKARRFVKKTSLQKFQDAEEVAANEVSPKMDSKDERPIRKRTVKATPPQPPDAEVSELESVQASRHNKTDTATVEPVVLINKLCGVNKTNKSQIEADAQVPRLEVTVHMYDKTKGEAAKCAHRNVSTDITNLDESIKSILQAGKQLQDEMQRRALDNSSQRRSETDAPQQPQEKLTDQASQAANYASKFNELEQHIIVLAQHLRKFENRTQQMRQENSKLALEKLQLTERIIRMEQQIAHLSQQGANGKELQHMLNEMRVQHVRYMDMTKAKEHYKKQWRRTAKQMHTLKLSMYEKNVQQEYDKISANVLNLKSVLTQDADEFEREYGQYRRMGSGLEFSVSVSESVSESGSGSRSGSGSGSGSGDSPEPLVKDYLRGLSSQTKDHHKPGNQEDSTRMH